MNTLFYSLRPAPLFRIGREASSIKYHYLDPLLLGMRVLEMRLTCRGLSRERSLVKRLSIRLPDVMEDVFGKFLTGGKEEDEVGDIEEREFGDSHRQLMQTGLIMAKQERLSAVTCH